MIKNNVIDKFSILVLNYNNFDYLFEMIDSIYSQSYPNIELVITDDASTYFDKDIIIDYISKKERQIKTSIFVNGNNIGTVKTINKYLKYLTGDYYLITASDDVFANEKVVSNYVDYFKNNNSNIITSQWIICNDDLKKIKNYIPKYKISQYNNSPEKILFEMCKCNRFGSGATAYRKELFSKYKFDETYIYLEDWPFWLKLLFNNEKIYVAPFDGLLHRSGGISETNVISSSKQKFFKELLETFHKEIIPNLKRFNFYKQWSIIDSYKFYIEYYGNYIDTSFYKNELNFIIYNNNKVKYYFYLNELNPHLCRKLFNLFKHNRIVLLSFLLTIIVSFIIANYVYINNIILLFMVLLYIFIYGGLNIVREVVKWLKWKNIQ